jgi:hypothetical protein
VRANEPTPIGWATNSLRKVLSTVAIVFAKQAAPCRQALRRMLLHPLGELQRAHQAGCIETSAKSEVVTVSSWQFAGEERLESTAMILIMIE